MADVSLLQMEQYMKGIARQRSHGLRTAGEDAKARFSLVDQLFTAGWREELLMAGLCYAVTVGGISAGADVSLVTGGGAGTTIDTDQPELIISVPTGYFLVPLAAKISAQVDLDADAEVANLLLFADTTQAVAATGVTGTAAAPKPLLGGGPDGASYGWHTVTADITDPVCSVLLDYETVRAMDAGAVASEQTVQFSLNYRPPAPFLMKGPCSLVACWGGTAAVTALAVVSYAVIPVGRFESGQ